MTSLLLSGLLALAVGSAPVADSSNITFVALVLHTYEARIRLDGRVSTTQVKASDAGHAKKLAQQQFPKATVLSVKKVD